LKELSEDTGIFFKGKFIWLNKKLISLSRARISVNDRGFLYGDGFFETLRVEAGRCRHLPEHLERLRTSARAFRLPFPEGLPWEERLAQLLAANGLSQGTAKVKIQLTRGPAPGLGLPEDTSPTLIIWAEPYEPPSPAEYAGGWRVVTFPEGRSTFVGKHKSLNYLFYLAARQYAVDLGAREALILEADGLVSEGAATSLVYARNGRFLTPGARSALPGVTVAVLARGLARRGSNLETVPTLVSDLKESAGLWLANSLMGLMPVASLDGVALPLSGGTAFLQEILAEEV
jgi:branched-chain amino acid aminotransferase/para-aminobenzoate synthetase component 1